MKMPFRKSGKSASVPTGRTIYAVGDIHGANALLDDLLNRIARDAGGLDQAHIVFLGDYVDRGPDSRGVIDQLQGLKKRYPQMVFLKGNHEAVMLDFLADPDEMLEWLEWGGDETLRSYGVSGALSKSGEDLSEELAAAMPKTHHDFLNNLQLTHREGDYLFVHAGVRPGVAIDDQQEDDLLWIRKAFHEAPADQRPDLTIVHGHHPMKKPLDAGWRIGVDTGACWSGRLSAVVLKDDQRRFLTTND